MTTVAEVDQAKVSQAVQKVSQIATLPEVTAKIIEVVEDPRSSARDLHEIIKHDLALSAKILKVVNSAFYGLPRQVASMDRAIVLLGLSTVKNIAIATSITKLFKGSQLSKRYGARDLWRHSLACGVFCKMIAQMKGAENCDEMLVAGLMHDIGIMVEMQVYQQQLAGVIDSAEENDIPLWEAELAVFGADHQAFGAGLAARWRFPEIFQLATGYHHDPLRTADPHRQVAATIHLADVLATAKGIGFQVQGVIECADEVLDLLELDEEKVNMLLDQFDEKFQAADSVIG